MPAPAPLVLMASKQRCFTNFRPPVSLLLLGNNCSSASPLCPIAPSAAPLQAVLLMDAHSPLACRLGALLGAALRPFAPLGFLSSSHRCSTGCCCCCLSAGLLAVLGHHSCTAVSLFSTDRFTAVALHRESHFPNSTSFLQCHLRCRSTNSPARSSLCADAAHGGAVWAEPSWPLCHSNRRLQSTVFQTPALPALLHVLFILRGLSLVCSEGRSALCSGGTALCKADVWLPGSFTGN